MLDPTLNLASESMLAAVEKAISAQHNVAVEVRRIKRQHQAADEFEDRLGDQIVEHEWRQARLLQRAREEPETELSQEIEEEEYLFMKLNSLMRRVLLEQDTCRGFLRQHLEGFVETQRQTNELLEKALVQAGLLTPYIEEADPPLPPPREIEE